MYILNYLFFSKSQYKYIKEVAFSPDGRVICSPFGFGLHLLAFNDNCADLSEYPPKHGEKAKR